MKKTRQTPKAAPNRDRRAGTAPSTSSHQGSGKGSGKGSGQSTGQGNGYRPSRAAAPAATMSARAGTVSAGTSNNAPAAAKAPPAKPGLQASTAKSNLLYGLHPVAAAWTNPDRKVRALFVTEGAMDALAPALAHAAELGIDRPEPTVADREQLDRLLPNGAVHQGAALDCGPLADLDVEDVIAQAETAETALVVVLDQVTDPHNVGAILRSAAAFGAMAVIVQDRHAPPLTGVLAKTASGAVEAVPLVRVTNLARTLTDLQQANFWCVGLAESGEKALHELTLASRTALVLGSEGEGIRRLTAERCDQIARLPTGGPVGSLNVSNAAAVALYEVARRR